MKRFMISLLGLLLPALMALAQTSPDEYNPTGPGDPGVPDTTGYYALRLTCSPVKGGAIAGHNFPKAPAGKRITLVAHPASGYRFVAFVGTDGILCEEPRYTFEMPAKDLWVEACFEYDPDNLPDPPAAQPTWRVVVNVEPADAGYTSYKVMSLARGEQRKVIAYANKDYKFRHWKRDGLVASTQNPITITMDEGEQTYTAVYEYAPEPPANPNENMFNAQTGELLVDYFAPGNLRSRMQQAMGDHTWDEVEKVTVRGRMNVQDCGFAQGMTGVSEIDLGATTGLRTIPANMFASCGALSHITLPDSLESVAANAFAGCGNVSRITTLSKVPPRATNASFAGLPDWVVLFIWSASAKLYKQAEGWKNFMTKPVEQAGGNMVALYPPQGVDLSEISNGHVCLRDQTTGNTRRQKIEKGKEVYIFTGTAPGHTYLPFVEGFLWRHLGELPAFEMPEGTVQLHFTDVLLPKTLKAVVLDPDGKEQDGMVSWLDAKGVFLTGNNQVGQVFEGDTLICRIGADIPSYHKLIEPVPDTVFVVGEADPVVTIQLEKRRRYRLCVRATDPDGKPVRGVSVQGVQRYARNASESFWALTNSTGLAEFDVADLDAEILLQRTGYDNQTMTLRNFKATSVPTDEEGFAGKVTTALTIVPSERSEEYQIFYDLTYRPARHDSEPEVSVAPNYADLILTLYDDVADTLLTKYQASAGIIHFPKPYREYNRLRLNVASKSDDFEPVDLYCDPKHIIVNAPALRKVRLLHGIGFEGELVQHGKLMYAFSGAYAGLHEYAYIFDAEGNLVGQGANKGRYQVLDNLKAGKYRVVNLQYDLDLWPVYHLSALGSRHIYEEWVDREVEDGKVITHSLAHSYSPETEKMENPTIKAETYFTANKNAINVGNMLTLRAKVTMKSEYAQLIDHMNLLVDMPEGVDFVTGSVMTGQGWRDYEYNDRQLVIPLQNVVTDNVRFCVMPTRGGDYHLTGQVQYLLAGKSWKWPAGTVTFDAGDISIFTPNTTNRTTIPVSGKAPGDSRVRVYDNNQLVGVTYSNPGGDWHIDVDLDKPYHYSRHEIRAEVKREAEFGSHTLRTPTVNVDYNEDTPVPALYKMIYNGREYLFDPLRLSLSKEFYTYDPQFKDFTFVVDFTENDPERISNVVFQVYNSDGTISEYNGRWQPATRNWATTMEYASCAKVPVNVKVQYMITPVRHPDHSEPFADQTTALHEAVQAIMRNVEKNGMVEEVTTDSEQNITGALRVPGAGVIDFRISTLPIEEVPHYMSYGPWLYRITEDSTVVAMRYEAVKGGARLSFAHREDNLVYQVTLLPRGSQVKRIGGVVRPGDVEEIPNITLPAMPTFYSSGWIMGNELSTPYQSFLAPGIDKLMSRGDYAQRVDDIQFLHQTHDEWNEILRRQVYARWSEGYYCLPDGELQAFAAERLELMKEDSVLQADYRNYMDWYTAALNVIIIEALAKAVMDKAGVSEAAFASRFFESPEAMGQILGNELGRAADRFFDAPDRWDYPIIVKENADFSDLWSLINGQIEEMHKKYLDLGTRLSARVWSIQKWGAVPYESFGHWQSRRFPLRNITPIIDPSGFVYEAVEGNRLEGVTATIYHKQTVEDDNGMPTERAVLWEARNYGQENPLVTGPDGTYQWDVPQGLWQVRFEKPGYQATQTDWLPVPPPQLEINIPMVENRGPRIKEAHAYSDMVEVEFDKYMKVSSLNPIFIQLSQGDTQIEATMRVLDQTTTSGNQPQAVGRRILIEPAEPLAEGTVDLFISQLVESYTSFSMEEDYLQTLTVEPRITQIVTPDTVRIAMGETLLLQGSILSPTAAQGKTLRATSASAAIMGVVDAALSPTDEGTFGLELEGRMMGTTQLRIQVDGYPMERSLTVQVVNRADYTTATPMASVESGELDETTAIELMCEDQSASIFFTLDGTSPATSATRLLYDGTPIVIGHDTQLQIVAVNEVDGLWASPVVTYDYTMKPGTGIASAAMQTFKAQFAPNGMLNISLGNEPATLSVTAADGKLMARLPQTSGTLSVQSHAWPAGIYIVQVQRPGTADQRVKLLKP